MTRDTFAGYAPEAGIPIVPAVGFYGGLGDLLATAAMGDWTAADHLTIAYALSSWRPTPGTRATGPVSPGATPAGPADRLHRPPAPTPHRRRAPRTQ